MSHIGKRPSVNTFQLTPQSADPSSPREGELYHSDGTARDEGPWVYVNGDWQQVSTGETLSTLLNLTLTPQAADPGSPAEGMLFVADGTSRTEGLWFYSDSDWVQLSGLRYQEFERKAVIEVRLATTTNVNLNSALENGDTLDGVTLATGNEILVKNQTTASENGVYTVNASGAPTRFASADTFEELNGCIVYVGFGSTNVNRFYYQTATLTSLSDNQVWSTTPPSETFTVPAGVYELDVEAVGGGGGGGGSRRDSSFATSRGAGGGGAGAVPSFFKQKVTPGEEVTVSVGVGGLPARNINSSGGAVGTTGGDGGATVLTFAERTVTLYGANGGGAGASTSSTGGGSGGSGGSTTAIGLLYTTGGNGADSTATNTDGQRSMWAAGGDVGTAATDKGGGGGAGRGTGGTTGILGANSTAAAASTSAGGGGGAVLNSTNLSTRSGWGGSGFVRFSWN
jgi:hypothetical protein